MKRVILLTILIAGASIFAQSDPSAVVASINDDLNVTLSELQGEIRTLPQEQLSVVTTKEGVGQVLDRIIKRKLLADKAGELQVDTVLVVKEAMQRSQDIVLADFLLMNIQNNANPEPVSEEEARNVYAENESLFYSSPTVELKQVVAVSQDQADDIEKGLKKGTDFDKMIEKYPGDPKGAKSGNLGNIPINQLSPEVVTLVGGLDSGDWGGPVKTDNGFHFLYLISTTKSEKLAFEDIQDNLIRQIMNGRAQNAVDSYLQSLIDESKITIDNSILDEAIIQQQPAGN
jgi:parvulin-like peptidyl-prolyl isomerase